MAVVLNVGGTKFQASIEILKRNPGPHDRSVFANMDFVEGEEIFINRDPTHFQTILDFIRDGRVDCRTDERSLAQIKLEAQYYGLESLVDTIDVIKELKCTPLSVFFGRHHH